MGTYKSSDTGWDQVTHSFKEVTYEKPAEPFTHHHAELGSTEQVRCGCGGTVFEVGYGDYLTVIRCLNPLCRYEVVLPTQKAQGTVSEDGFSRTS